MVLVTVSSCKKDPCETTLCLNNGTCVDGVCLCPEEYMGVDCSEMVVPSAVRVNEIELLYFPGFMYDGSSWDENNGKPDVKITVSRSSDVLYESEVYENANSSDGYTFTPVLDLSPSYSTYSIKVYDQDENEDQLMTLISFTGYSHATGRPTVLFLDNDFLIVRLYVEYIF